jgi:uncharacterized protein YbcC (UPF0753/DUF2309 family)
MNSTAGFIRQDRVSGSARTLRSTMNQPAEHSIVVMKSDEGPDLPHSSSSAAEVELLRHAIAHAAHFLPAQGPITVFIHHNTLHAFEDQSFEEAVLRGAEIFGCQPYLSEDRYRTELGRGRIAFEDLGSILRDELGSRANESIDGLANRFEIRLAMLQHAVWTGPVAELNWFVEETDALWTIRPDVAAASKGRLIAETRRWAMRDLRTGTESNPDRWIAELFARFPIHSIETWSSDRWEAFSLQALWSVCRKSMSAVPAAPNRAKPLIRPRNVLLACTGVDADEWTNGLMIRFCAAFLDQGLSHCPLPDRAGGLYQSFISLHRESGTVPDPRLRALARESARLWEAGLSPAEAALDSLAALGVPAADWEDFITATLLALPGWAGMVQQVAIRSDSVAHAIPKDSLEEFLAVRLLLDCIAAKHLAAEELAFTGPLRELRAAHPPRPAEPCSIEQRAFPVFQLAQVFGWSAKDLLRLTPAEWSALVEEVESFSNLERRRVFHLGYEMWFRTQTLDALALHQSRFPQSGPRFQLVTCLDEREESFRRHLEETAPDCETFGAAGFFNVAMYFKGAADAHFVPLCPIVLTPQHWVEERVCDGKESEHRRRAAVRKAMGAASVRFQTGTRSFAFGAILSASVGALGAVPLVGRILFPRLAAWFERMFSAYVQAPAATRLRLERTDAVSGPEIGHQGYSLDEMAAVSERLLRDIGLIRGFSRLLFVIGHGSDSLNNPHKSAYDCGACGGSPGAPNGRALAQMLNDPRVRSRIAANGIVIPESTWVVGGFHNTCDDTVTLADLDCVPDSHRVELNLVQENLKEACRRNADERCRRFVSAPLNQSSVESHRHVHERSVDLAQARPELGHATNAICIVARRERSRGLYFDRRAFLTSYDPTQDDDVGSTLARLLGAAVPVCGGINLEYYFSHVDNRGYGCGTKLPHNVTALLGVMDGAASDLRTGLPWQMVEIHEPVRLLFVIETTPEILLGIMDRSPVIGGNIRNGWVQVALLDPHSSKVLLYRKGAFEPYEPRASRLPTAKSSVDWYHGWREHLEFAEIGGPE